MRLRPSAAGAALFVVLATSAWAQSAARPERPSRALFGSGIGDVSQLLTAAGSLGGGFDSSLASDASGRQRVTPTDFDSSGKGIVTGLRGTLGYSLATQKATVVASAETAPRYYPSRDQFLRRDHAVARGTLNLPFSIVAMGSAGYVPYSALGLSRTGIDTDGTDVPDTDLPVSLHHYVTWSTGLSTSHRLSRRAWIGADTTYSTRRIGGDGRQFRTAGGGGRFRYQVGRNVFLKAGYHYADASYSDRVSYVRHLFDVGADASHDLAIARRTTFSFSTGTSMITYPASQADEAGGRSARNRFRLAGSAELRHEMGRTWAATVGYQRGVQFLEAWPDPVLSDSATAKVEGSVSRRVQFSASLRASTGRNARLADDNGFNLYHGSATLTYAFNRHVNAGLLLTTYRHRFSEQVTLPPGFEPWFERHRVIAQVSFWTPLLSRTRRVNATR